MIMKILLLGLYYSDNKGDALLTDCTEFRIHQTIPGAEVIVRDLFGRTMWKKAHGGEKAELKKRILRNKLRTFVSSYTIWDKMYTHEQYLYDIYCSDIERVMTIPCDCVIFAGGQIFMDDLALVISNYIDFFSSRKIPIIINAAGWGPFCSRHIRAHLERSLQSQWIIDLSARDHIFQLNHLTGKKISIRADLGLFADETYGIGRNFQNGMTGLGIMFAPTISGNKMIRFWKKIIILLTRRKIPWMLFTNGYPSDEEFAEELLRKLPEECFYSGKNRNDYLLPAPQTPEEMVAQISTFQSMISMRLHSHITAASLGIPSVAIIWDDKLSEFFNMIGYIERCLSVNESADKIVDVMIRAEKEGVNRDTIRKLRETADKCLVASIRRAEIIQSSKQE